MYRVELQYDDISTTQLDPRKIPHYPINEALSSVGGRNLVGLPWNALAEKQAQGAQAMLRDKALRSISITHGIPEVHLGQASPDLVALHTPSQPAPPPCPDCVFGVWTDMLCQAYLLLTEKISFCFSQNML